MWMRHFVISGLLDSEIFSTLSLKRQDFKKLLNMKVSFDFCYKFSETLLILRKTERDMIKKFIRLHIKYRYSYQMFMKLEFYGQVFERYQNIKFCQNPPIGSRVVPCGRTDRRDKNISRFSKLRKRA
jgi:hypothetical protein